MNFNIFRSRPTVALLLFAILLLIGLLLYYQRAMQSKVNLHSVEIATIILEQEEIYPTNSYEQKSRIAREFLLNRDYENALNLLRQLVNEDNLPVEDYEKISFAFVHTCIMLHNFDEAIVQLNRLERESQNPEWKIFEIYIDIRKRNYDEAIMKLTQIEKTLEDTHPLQIFVFGTRSAIHLSIQQHEQSKVDFDNLLRVVELNFDDMPDGIIRYVNAYQMCFDLYTTHPENYCFDFDDTLPTPEKSDVENGKVSLEIRFDWVLVSTVDGSVVHTCSIAL